jgi:proteic killer suppression protein
VQVRFEDEDLARLEAELDYTGGHSPAVVRGFRKTMQRIRAALDERDLRTNATRFEKLSGARQHECSMRINDQFRLILKIEQHQGAKVVAIAGIEDYH